MNKLAKILLIDDDLDLHSLIRISTPTLSELDCAVNENEAIKLLKKNNYDLIIIDINLIETTGFQFLNRLKNDSLSLDSIKIILTASQNEEDEVNSHKLEVDDFVMKPIRPIVFSALIEKHLKKRILADAWTRGSLRIDISKMFVEGKMNDDDFHEITLTPKEFKILVKLIYRPGQVFSREQIFEGVWNEDDNDEKSLRAIDTHISALRKKISPFGAKLSSVRGVGYKIELH